MVFKVIPDIVNTSFWHWLSFAIERVRPKILGHVILPRFIPVQAKPRYWASSFASFILPWYMAKEPSHWTVVCQGTYEEVKGLKIV